MHVYLRDEPIRLEMRTVDPEGLAPQGSDLVAVAFHVTGRDTPSFRALLPSETLAVLAEALREPVRLGLLAEEPEEGAEIQAMVGVAVPVGSLEGGAEDEDAFEDEDEQPSAAAEPWRESVPTWEEEEEEEARTALLAFAPLIRLHRRFPDDFGEELADLLETALAGQTKSVLEARIDRLLGDL
jgi:hypothetical protein